MNVSDASAVYTQNTSNLRIHRQIREASGRLLSDERCNLDDTDALRVLTPAEFAEAVTSGGDLLCRYCFPAGHPIIPDADGEA